MHSKVGAKYNQSFQVDADDLQIIEENLILGKYRDKSKMFRDSLVKMNEQLKTVEATA